MKNETLETRYDGDAVLLKFYATNLPKAGWPGSTDDCEREYRRRYRANQSREPRGKPFQPKTPSSVRDVDEVEDLRVPTAAR